MRWSRIGLNKPGLNQPAGQEELSDPGSVTVSHPDESGLPGGGEKGERWGEGHARGTEQMNRGLISVCS